MIPIIINNRDLMPQNLLRQIMQLDGVGPGQLIDNASTYPPLLEWFKDPGFWPAWFGIYRWPNSGPRAACRLVNELREQWTKLSVEYYATTDSDIDLDGVPANVLQVAAEILRTKPEIVKVGLALRLDDLPDTKPARLARAAEEKHWQNEIEIHIRSFDLALQACPSVTAYRADIDTTFAVYRLNPPWDGSYGPSIRLAGRYQARHLPWYHTDTNRPPDYQWYLDHADPTGTYYTAAEIASRAPK